MARDPAERVSLRALYLKGLSLEVAAQQCNIPLGTARNWKRYALEAGDDWDKLRSAQLLAGGDIEEVMRRVLSAMVLKTEATLEQLHTAEGIPLAEQVQLITSLGDSLNKMQAALRRMMPETDALAVRLDTLKRLAEFVRTKFPASAPALVEVLEAFGEEVARG